MAYRRSVNPRFRERLAAEAEDYLDNDAIGMSSSSSSPSSTSTPSSLATKAIRASSAHRDSSLSSAYSSPSSPRPSPSSSVPPIKNTKPYEYTSMKSLSEPKQSFWGTLARKAKAILDDESMNQSSETTTGVHQTTSPSTAVKIPKDEGTRKRIEPPSLTKGLDKITSSLNYIGGTIGNAVEEGLTVVENRTAGIIQETRKHIKKTPSSPATRKQQPLTQNDLEIQLKASRDVSMAMAAKAKLLLRELKTVKADLAFAKQRCAQLEEENKALRENHSRGDNPEDDDLIRLQLETLVAEKARLAHENSIYARENRFLREVVEYHQLTMQDVVYLDEKTEEVTEVYPVKVTPLSNDASYSGTPELGNISSSSSSIRMKP